MRNTNRTLTCDRCGLERRVIGFSWAGLHAATFEGWAKYAAATARTNINPHNYKDLCPECSEQMNSVMESGSNDMKDNVQRYLSYMDDTQLTAIRDWATRQLRERRSA